MKLNSKKFLSCCILLGLSVSSNSYAWDVNLGLGTTGDSQSTIRLGISQDWDSRWLESSAGYFSGYWDFGATYWESGIFGKDAYSFSASPVLTYVFNPNGNIQPYLEVGIGGAFFTRTKVGDQNLGSSFNFEDRIGFGANIGNHKFGVRATHYSNAGLKKPNDGIENYSLNYSYKF